MEYLWELCISLKVTVHRDVKQGGALILSRLSQGWGTGGFFQKNILASLFNDDLSNEPNVGRIHLAGHCGQCV
jgi:hypothetical protein